MIQSQFTKTSDGQWLEMEISGHAGSGEYGFDVMCASVSMLAFNFVNSVAELTQIEPKLKTVEDGGFLVITKPEGFNETQEQVWQTLFASVVIGLENLSENATEYVAKPVFNTTEENYK